jgi:hypothetical protein
MTHEDEFRPYHFDGMDLVDTFISQMLHQVHTLDTVLARNTHAMVGSASGTSTCEWEFVVDSMKERFSWGLISKNTCVPVRGIG